MLTVNPVFITDVYKLGHIHLYPKGLTKVYSTLIPRSNKYMKGIDTVVSFGIEMFVQKWLVDYWNDNFFNIPFEEIEREYKVIVGDMLGEDNASVDHLRKLHELGYLPLRIKAIEEGKSVPIGTPIATVENTHEDFPWLVNYIETVFISEVYVPTTVATVARELKSIVSKHAELTSDTKDHLIWQCHDFSERGQHGNGASQLSGVAHLTSFAGSDTIQASNVARKYYNASNMVKRPLMGSVLASEHSVMQSYGSKNEFECYETLINENRNGILSLVSDTYDYFNVIDNILPSLKDSIMTRNGKVVVRPDCYSSDTMIYTPKGWKLFKDLTENDLVAQIMDDGSYEFVKPLEIINQEYSGDMYEVKDHHGKMDMLVTPNHRMIFKQKCKDGWVERVKNSEDMKSQGNYKQRYFKSAFNDKIRTHLSDIDRLKIAFQADGSYTSTGNKIRFAFAKERKINRMKDILNRIGCSYKTYNLSDNRVEINIDLDSSEFTKNFDWIDIETLNLTWCEEFIEELSHWDAHIRNTGRIKFDTTNKDVIDLIEIIAINANMGVLISEYDDNRSEKYSRVYTAHIMKNCYIGGEGVKYNKVHYEGTVHCVKVPSGRVLVKRNRSTLVCGNSGDPKKVLAGNDVIYIDNVSNSHDAMRSFKESIYLSMPISKDKFDSIEFIENFEDVLDNLMIGSNIETGYEFDDKYQHSLYKHKAILSYQFEEELRYVPIEFGTRKSKETNENEVYVNLDVDRKITNEDLGSLHILYKHFGGSKNSKGYFVLDSHIGLSFGEGFDRTKMEEVLTAIAIAGFSTENVVFGVGAYIYSVNVTRDSFGFAFKSQMVVVEGEERMIYKNPKGDSSKRSLRGGVAVMDWKGMKTTYQDLSFKELKEIDESGEDLLKLVYLDGERKLHTDFEEIITRIENKE